MDCKPESGIWHNEGGHPVLYGAICSRDHEEGLYRIDFADTGVDYAFAPGISQSSGTLETLGELGDMIIYADDSNMYAVSRSTMKVSWTRPWIHLYKLPPSPDGRMMGFIMNEGNNPLKAQLKVLAIENGRIEDVLSAAVDLESNLDFVWQTNRLVRIDQGRLTWWPREGTGFHAPVTVAFSEPLLSAEDCLLDDGGLLVIDRRQNRIAYYRFETQSRVQAHLNSTASVRGLGGSPTRAMGVTSDLNIVRVVARRGNVLLNRYEAKYWRVRDDAPMLLADGETLVLDGGDDNRSQSVDTSAMTWKRLSLFEYRTPGRLALLQNDVLTTIHNAGATGDSPALVQWNTQTGERISTLPFSAFSAIGGQELWTHIEKVTTIPGVAHFLILELSRPSETNPELSFVILDTAAMKLAPDGHVFRAAKLTNGLPSSLSTHRDGFTLSELHGEGEWFIFDDVTRTIQHKRQQDIPNKPAVESLSSAEKWYGYCYQEHQCVVPAASPDDRTPVFTEQREQAWHPRMPETKDHHPPMTAWIVAVFSFFAMLLTTAWRNGVTTKSQLCPSSTNDDASFSQTAMEIFDHRNRRFITERDRVSFLAPSFLSRTWFRLVLSCAVGIGVAFAVAFRFFNDDVPSAFFAWMTVLSLPILSAVWVISSWKYWNRKFLLHFGRFVEGKWLNCATPNQTIAYTVSEDKTFELSHHQWVRADFVPIVVYDPARPKFAVQYTGACYYNLGERLAPAEHVRPASSFDVARLFVVTLILSGCICATQMVFKSTYPNPLSVGELNAIASKETPFITKCLHECVGEGCFRQCQNRQMRLVYDDAGYPLDADPDVTPQVIIQKAHAAMESARTIVQTAGQSCHEKAQQLQSVPLMPEKLSHAFWSVYADQDAYAISDIDPEYRKISADMKYFHDLCDSEGACAFSSEACPEPPSCFGSASFLKTELCRFAGELQVPEIRHQSQ